MNMLSVALFSTIWEHKEKNVLHCFQCFSYKVIVLLCLMLNAYSPVNAHAAQKGDTLKIEVPADSIFVQKPDFSYTTFNGPLTFSSFIQVKVHGLSRLQKLATQKKKPVILFLDGISMNGIISVGGDKKNDVLFFVLHRDSASMMKWSLLKKIVDEKKEKALSISVGFEGEQAFPTKFIKAAELSRAGDCFLAILAGTLFIIIFTFLVKRSDVLVDRRNSSSGKYSLAKVLLAAWLFLILFYLVYILSTTNSLPHLPDTILVMIIFSAITLLGTKIHQSLHPSPNLDNPSIERISKGFLVDILTNAQGLSLFKIQLLLFNLFTMIYITIELLFVMVLPSFELRFIVLIGLSHLLYLGSLFFEKPY